jgi:hypothetical protein
MTTYPGDDEGLEATEVPATARSAFDPDQGDAPEADDAPQADDAPDAGSEDADPANSDPGF